MKSPQFHVHAELEQTHWWFTARRQIVRTLIERVAPPSAKSLIVEIGCGTGGNVAELSTGYRCIGVDRDPTAIELARQRFPAVTFINGEAPKDVESELRQASAILLLDVLEHVEDDFLLFSQVMAALRPGAFLLVTVPADPQLWTKHDVSFGHFRRYDQNRLEVVWAGLAVSCLLCSHFNSRLYLPIKWMRTFNRQFHRTSGQAGTDISRPLGLVNRFLHHVFAGEGCVLAEALATSKPAGYPRGVSLIAVLRRDPGTIVPRCRPAAVEKDCHGSELGWFASESAVSKSSVEVKGDACHEP